MDVDILPPIESVASKQDNSNKCVTDTTATVAAEIKIPCAIPLITYDDKSNTFDLNEEGLSVFKNNYSQRFGIVSVIGKFRTGKSYLLNQIIYHLAKQYTSSSWHDHSAMIAKISEQLKAPSCFKVGHSQNSTTKGIYIYPVSFDFETSGVRYDDGTGSAEIFILDVEGLGSPERSNSYDDQLYALSMFLSSICIYNTGPVVDRESMKILSKIKTILEQQISQAPTQPPPVKKTPLPSAKKKSLSETKVATASISTVTVHEDDAIVPSIGFEEYAPILYWIMRDYAGLDFAIPVENNQLKACSPNDYLHHQFSTTVLSTSSSSSSSSSHLAVGSTLSSFFVPSKTSCIPMVHPIPLHRRLTTTSNVSSSSTAPFKIPSTPLVIEDFENDKLDQEFVNTCTLIAKQIVYDCVDRNLTKTIEGNYITGDSIVSLLRIFVSDMNLHSISNLTKQDVPKHSREPPSRYPTLTTCRIPSLVLAWRKIVVPLYECDIEALASWWCDSIYTFNTCDLFVSELVEFRLNTRHNKSSNAIYLRWQHEFLKQSILKCKPTPKTSPNGFTSYNAKDDCFDEFDFNRWIDAQVEELKEFSTDHNFLRSRLSDDTAHFLAYVAEEVEMLKRINFQRFKAKVASLYVELKTTIQSDPTYRETLRRKNCKSLSMPQLLDQWSASVIKRLEDHKKTRLPLTAKSELWKSNDFLLVVREPSDLSYRSIIWFYTHYDIDRLSDAIYLTYEEAHLRMEKSSPITKKTMTTTTISASSLSAGVPLPNNDSTFCKPEMFVEPVFQDSLPSSATSMAVDNELIFSDATSLSLLLPSVPYTQLENDFLSQSEQTSSPSQLMDEDDQYFVPPHRSPKQLADEFVGDMFKFEPTPILLPEDRNSKIIEELQQHNDMLIAENNRLARELLSHRLVISLPAHLFEKTNPQSPS